MEAQRTANPAPTTAPDEVMDDTHEAALRIAREREARDRRLREADRQARAAEPHELHTSIGS